MYQRKSRQVECLLLLEQIPRHLVFTVIQLGKKRLRLYFSLIRIILKHAVNRENALKFTLTKNHYLILARFYKFNKIKEVSNWTRFWNLMIKYEISKEMTLVRVELWHVCYHVEVWMSGLYIFAGRSKYIQISAKLQRRLQRVFHIKFVAICLLADEQLAS